MRALAAALITAIACVASVHAQVTTITNYTTGFFSSPDWDSAGDPPWEGQEGWVGAGGSDSVSVVSGYSGPGGASGTLGLFEPLSTPIFVAREFAPMDTGVYTNISIAFAAEFAILELDSPNGLNDTFVFDLRDAGGATSLLSFSMQAPAAPGFDYTLSSTDAGGTSAQWSLNYDAVYRMEIALEGDLWTGNLYGVTDPSGSRIIDLIGAFDGGTLANGLEATDFANLQAAWILDSGDVEDLGTIALSVNEFTIASTGEVIPEPSTWALLLGALLAAGFYRWRQLRRPSPRA